MNLCFPLVLTVVEDSGIDYYGNYNYGTTPKIMKLSCTTKTIDELCKNMVLYYELTMEYYGTITKPKLRRVWGHFALNFKLGDYFCCVGPVIIRFRSAVNV